MESHMPIGALYLRYKKTLQMSISANIKITYLIINATCLFLFFSLFRSYVCLRSVLALISYSVSTLEKITSTNVWHSFVVYRLLPLIVTVHSPFYRICSKICVVIYYVLIYFVWLGLPNKLITLYQSTD